MTQTSSSMLDVEEEAISSLAEVHENEKSPPNVKSAASEIITAIVWERALRLKHQRAHPQGLAEEPAPYFGPDGERVAERLLIRIQDTLEKYQINPEYGCVEGLKRCNEKHGGWYRCACVMEFVTCLAQQLGSGIAAGIKPFR